MANPFDAFDQAGAAVGGNPFDAFDANGAQRTISASDVMAYREGEQNQIGSGIDPLTGANWDAAASEGELGKVLTAFGHGVKDGWGAEPLGMPDDLVKGLREAGIFNDYQSGRASLVKSFNEAFMRPAAVGLSAVLRGSTALFQGFRSVAQEGGAVGALVGPLVAAGEAFPFGFAGMGAPGAFRAALTPQLLDEARSLNVIGPGGEAAWKGLAEPEPVSAEAIRPTVEGVSQAAEGGLPGAEASSQPASDIHAVARQIAPDVFSEYDALRARRSTYRQWLDELAEQRRRDAEESAPHGQMIEQIEGRLEAGGLSGRQARQYREQLAEMTEARDRHIAGALSEDTPMMAIVRQDLMSADERMRDLAPDVSAAYRAAEERMPVAPPEPVAEPTATEAPPVAAMPETTPPAAAARSLEGGIVGDVSRKLVAAGRPAEEADAAAALVAARYQARAANLRGTTAEGLYSAEAPDISAAEGRKGAAGATTLGDDRATIRLMGKADASTFIHETGHNWLEELMRDAADERATDAVRTDAATVRQWLGVEEGQRIPTKAHEKFARGFERYMMEGTAPSRALADVFAKFKAWLTTIYQTVGRLRAPITDDIRRVFDRMLATAPERIPIAPERVEEPSLFDRHENAVAVTPPARAGFVADSVRADRDAITGAQAPEEHGELIRGREEAGRGEIGREAPDRHEPASEPLAGEAGTAPQSRTVGSGGGEAEVAGAGARAPEPVNLYTKVPKEPLRLTSFLQRNGGLIDESGDVAQIIGGARSRPGLINNRRGMRLDDAALKAWEEGYFPELGTRRPSVNELLEAIEADLKLAPRYSAHDDAAAQAYRDAIGRNAQIDRLAADLKIDAAGMSHNEFWDAVADRLSMEDLAREIAEQSAGFEADLAELDRRAREWMEERGDAWEPERFYDNAETRSLEDLEREHEQREAATGAGGGAGGAELPGTAGAVEGVGEAGAGQGIGGAGVGERGGTEGSQRSGGTVRPRGPNDEFAPAGTDLVDKAGNIRLDKLNTPEAVDAVIREMSGENDEFQVARRGVVSDQQVLDLASSMGLRPEDLNVERLRAEFSPERIQATRELFVQTASQVFELSKSAAEGDQTAIVAYMTARSRLRMVQEYLSALTAETGRGLRAFRVTAGGMEQAKAIAAATGDLAEERTLFQMRQEAARISKLGTAAQVSGYLRDVDKPGFGAMALEVFTNWLISGPITHMSYSVGNATLALWRAVPETAAQATVGAIQRTLGVKGAEASRRFGEIGAQLYALYKGQRNGFQAAWDSFKSGQTMPLPGEVEAALPGFRATTPFNKIASIPNFEVGGVPVPVGSIVRIPGERMVAPIHSYFRAIGYEQGIAAAAYGKAAEEGLLGDAFNARVAELTNRPTLEMMATAREGATQQTLMGRGGGLTQRVSSLVNWETNLPGLGPTRPLKFIDPFVHIASNIVEQAVIQRGPLGLLSQSLRDDIMGRNGAGAQADAIGRMSAGVALSIVGGGLAMEGLITPSAPSDHNEAAMWRLVNGMPHALKIGNWAYDLSRLGVLGFGLGIAADLYHVADSIGKEDATKVASLLVHSFAQNFLDEGFMRGPSDLIKALDEPDRYGARYAQNLLTSFAVPYSVGMAQVAHEIDPYAREARTLMDQIKAKLPWWSETLMPRRDIWGNPVLNREWAGTYQQRLQNDAVNQAMMRLEIFPARPERKIRGVELTDQQYDDFARIAGRNAYAQVQAIVATPGFSVISAGIQKSMIRNAIEGARKNAADLILMLNPSILRAAIEAKKSIITGEKPPHGGWKQETVH